MTTPTTTPLSRLAQSCKRPKHNPSRSIRPSLLLSDPRQLVNIADRDGRPARVVVGSKRRRNACKELLIRYAERTSASKKQRTLAGHRPLILRTAWPEDNTCAIDRTGSSPLPAPGAAPAARRWSPTFSVVCADRRLCGKRLVVRIIC
jgi:hypothetical protein